MKTYYHPEPIFGIPALRPEPIECEVLARYTDGTVKIRYSVPKNALIFILAGVPPEKRKPYSEERIVNAKDVYETH